MLLHAAIFNALDSQIAHMQKVTHALIVFGSVGSHDRPPSVQHKLILDMEVAELDRMTHRHYFMRFEWMWPSWIA